ncbi:Histone deacetylase hda1 [Exophiala xenobiotica]|uniref:Histone deacetylase n=1 Tax=Vermiconidia calcicola TaxID=1690605 RepID=A0AAV9QC28_9PEZI|nr:Histone deacetylase hda1 [Exophiala xenobiotica]KAK5432778.1 Histone deacetylase hda1 [Exophiala xenobiotica]KAK5539822.1 Histone deacetylase hda1 [Vermiconidia calcicola]
MSYLPPAGYGGPSDRPRFPNPIPKLEEPPHISDDTSMRDTPDMAGDLDHRLKIETSDEDEEYDDSLLSDTSSEADEVPKPQRGLPVSQLPTGLCYDDRMRYHAEVAATSGENVHPEDPRRIYYIYKELCEAGLVDDKKYPSMVDMPLLRIDAREATRDECLLVHTRDHYEFVKSTAELSDEKLIDLSDDTNMDSIYFNALSYFSSKLSAGAAIETCRAVFSRKVKNAIAVIRPPGHHAEVDRTMGFCLFNNVCIASKVCQSDFGDECRKILIVDWDVHHGNGCQKAFYQDPNILYISLHVHMNGMFYPSGNEGDMFHCGEGPGLGKNVNIPWPTKGMADGDYMYAFQNVVMPIATEFDPDFVIVASGFDAAAGDELGGCYVTPPCYAHMTHMLMSLAGGKIAVCLEGGYNFHAISKSALAVTRVLMGEPPDRVSSTQASHHAVETVAKVRTVQSKYWRSIYPKDPIGGIFGGERLHDIIRQWQAQHLYDKYKLTQLHIFRDNISKSFEQQVLATPNYETKKRLLIIFHDAPDLLGHYNGLSTQQKLHDTWLVDGAQSYIKWAVSHGFAVIDINVPQHITINDEDSPEYHDTDVEYASTMTDVARKEGEKLAQYLWENYVEPWDFVGGIFLMGAGTAFHALAKLVSENENVYPSLLGIIGFIATNPIRPISNPSSHWVSQWYRENSLVYVSHVHSLWKKDNKPSRKYGRLVQSGGAVLNVMMKMHEDEVTEWIKEKVRDAAGGDGSDVDESIIDSAAEGDDGDDEVRNDGKNGGAVSDSGDTIDDPAAAAAASGLDMTAARSSGVSAGGGVSGGLAAGVLSQGTTTGQRVSMAGGGDVYMTTER